MRVVLNAGCGPLHPLTAAPPSLFPRDAWRELRLDADPAVAPDLVGNTLALPLANGSVGAVWTSHNLEHVHTYDVPRALAEFRRVLAPGGALHVAVPDLAAACALVAQGRENQPAYISPAGPITALDIIFGHRGMAAASIWQRHLTGFTSRTLYAALAGAGFAMVHVGRDGPFGLRASARAP